MLYWEHEGNKGVRKGKWKLVCKFPGKWELYDMENGRTEVDDVSKDQSDIVQELLEAHNNWSERCNVIPWEELLKYRK